MSAKARRRVFALALLLGVANVAAYVAYTWPRSLRKKNVASRIEQLKVELGNDRSRLAALQARAEAINANRAESRVFLEEKVAAPGTSLVPILREVESLAKQQGLSVGTQRFSRELVEGLPLEKFAIGMPVSGTYDQVTGLLVQLERSTHFLTLDEIAARQQQNQPGQESVALNLQFSAYFRASAEARPEARSR
ncbi:MAG TPA: GspMb/PilO family protein [Vicinamibacteria bacterium]|nr:GspMb/PilO family protein [Vicinamibacteria bacterium]